MMHVWRRIVAFLVFFACAASANAQSYTYSIYVDADNSAATGCNVSTPGGTLSGIESALAIAVTAGTPPTVTSLTRSSCSGSALGAPVAEGTGAVTVGGGVGGTTSIELSDALINLAGPSASSLRLYVVAQSASGNDVLLNTTGAAGGAPIILSLQAPASGIVPTPLFGIPALLLLGATLLALGSRAVRRRMIKRLMLGLVLLSGMAGAAIFDWNGVAPLATDPAGDSSSGESAIDLRYLLSAVNGTNVFFRLDINSNLAVPPPKPVAVADTYQSTINTPLNVAAPGVLANDTLNGGSISGNTNPSHGTVVLNANGSFIYTPTTGFTGADSFNYTLSNAGGSSTALVNIVVQNGPSAQPDTYTTIVGSAINIAAPGVLGNDNLGNPNATLQSFGGGSLGGAVTANAPGATVALGASGGNLTLNANGSLTVTAPTTAGTYTFLYRIGNVKGTSDGTVTIQVNKSPSITSVGPANFAVGTNSTYTITTTGTPTVTSITLTGCTLPAGLSFSYTSGATATISGTATAAGTVSCTVTASNGVSPNATQTLVVNANAGPAAQPDNYTTTVGTALNVSAPGVLGNDTLGSPAATLSSFGGGSLGGAVTSNAPGASVALGASGGTLTLNANGSLSVTAPTTAGTYTFLYRIGNVQGTSDGTVTIQVNQAPSITSVGPANFAVGTNSTYTITTTGTPTVTSITLTGCTLPAGLSFNYTSGATATISGNASVGGTVSCTVTASNGVSPNATQTLVVNVNAGPAAQPDNYSTKVGTALVVSAPGVLSNDTLGTPAATLSSFGGGSLGGSVTTNTPGTGVALAGGTLTLNADGSLNLTAPTTAGTYTFLYRIGNVQGTSDGTVTIQVNQAPSITSVGPANFSLGTNATYNITTTGTPTVTSITLTGCVLPAGLSFSYTSGANATISGTATATGSVVCTVTADNGITPQATQSLTVNANAGPAAVSDSYSTTVGAALSVAAPGVLSNDTLGFPQATLTKFGGGTLGGSVTDNNAGASVVLTGSGGTLTVNADGSIALTAPTTAGTYTFQYRITNSQGSSDGTVTIQVNQAPSILSPNNVTFLVGTAQTFTITTSGTPTVNSITLTGCALPAGLSFNYTSGATATISGTPTANGNVNCTVTASNGVAPAAVQTLAVAVNQGPAAVADNYSTLVGTALNVSAPGLLQNDTLGNPVATLTFFGGNSLGGVVTDHAAGTSVAFGTSGGTLTVNADGSLGLTAPTTAGQYTFQYRIANGVSTSDAMVTIDVNQSAAITSAASTTFTDGQANSFGVTTTGFPSPSLSIGAITPALAGVSFVDNGNGTATLSGSPALGTAGTYTFTITAHNGIGADATQNFTLQVNEKPVITSGTTTTFTVGTAGTFSVTTTGSPTPSIARGGVALPSGVNFVDNGNGTGTLSGTPAAGTGGSYAITFTATNSAGSTPTQNFTLVINEAPVITSLATTTFTVGSAGTFTITTTGNPTAAINETGSLPGGVNFTDNGNGTATLAGTPNAGTGGTYPITINASNGVGSTATQSFTLQVHEAPAITSANTITFTAGVSGANFTVTTTGTPTPSIARGGVALPAGVTFTDNGNGTATLVNNPAAGTGGSYAITFTASNGVGSNAVQSFTLIINQSPAITSVNNASFVIGQAGQTFAVTTTGFPTGASMAITQSPNPDNLPANVTFTNNGNGTATIAGTPAAGTKGSYALTINANNGVAPAASQAFTFTVTCPVISLLPAPGTFNADYNAAFSQGFTPSGGTAPYTYTLGGAALPSVGFSGNNLTGTPNNTGTFAFTVKATDANGCDSAVQSYTLNVYPVVANDAYGNILGNVLVNSSSGAPFSVTGNDQFPAGGTNSITAFDATSAHSGTVTMTTSGGSLGQFTYDPPVGYSGADSFTYTLTSNGLAKTGTVSFNVGSPTLWFVNNAAGACPGAPCNGRQSHPFTNVSAITNDGAATNPKINDNFFVYSGSGAYSGTLTLLANQDLIGQAASTSLATLTGLTTGVGQTLPATGGASPVLTSVGVVVTVSTGNSIHGLTLGNGTAALSGSAFGTLVVNDNVVINSNGRALDLINGTLNATFNSVTSTGGANNVSLVQIAGTADLGGGALSGATGTSFAMGTAAASSGGSATVNYSGTITQATSGQAPIIVQNRTGGTLTLSGAITATAAGVKGISLLNNNASTTTAFTGPLTLTTTTNAGFNATGGGIVTATDTTSTITTTIGTALNIANTTIGAANVTFRSVSANGAANGIVLNNTGAGRLLVVGNAGTCTSLASTCTGGTIQATTGHAIDLTATTNPSFSFIKITNIALSGIHGTQVSSFTLANSVIDGVNTAHSASDADVAFNVNGGGSTENNLSGAVSITNNVINNSYQAGIDILNYAGTISNLTITGNSFTSNSSATLSFGSAVSVVANKNNAVATCSATNCASITAGSISSNTINNFPNGAGVLVIVGNGGGGSNPMGGNIASLASPLLIQDNTITGFGPGAVGLGTNGVQITVGHQSDGFFAIGASGHPNNITNVKGNGVACSKFGNNGNSGANASKCIIAFNTINANNTVNSPGINTGADNATANTNTPTLYLDIHNNNVSNTTGAGIMSTIRSVDGTGVFNIVNNTVGQPIQGTTAYGIRVDSGNGSESAGATVCLKINGNTATGGKNGSGTIQAPGIGLRQQHVAPISTFNIDGLSPNPASDGGQMEGYVNGQNPGSASGTFGVGGTASISSGATYHAATCTIP